jgi:MFS family permease
MRRTESAYSRYVLGALLTAYAVNYLDRQILAVMLEPIKQELGASDSAMGFLTGTAFGLFFAIAGIPIARWADRGVRRDVLVIGMVAWSGLTALCGAVGHFWQLALLRMGVAVGEAAGVAPSHALISDYFEPKRRATALGIYAVGPLIGIALGSSLGGWLSDTIGWRLTFVVVGLPGLALALLVRATIREPERGRFDPQPEAPALAVRNDRVFSTLWTLRSFRLVAPAHGLACFSAFGFSMWAPAFLMRVHDLSATEMGLFLGTVSAPAGALSAALGGWLGDRLGRRNIGWYAWLPAITLLAALPFQTLLLLSDTRWLVLTAFVPAGLLGGAFAPLAYAIVQNLAPPRMRSVASAILLLFSNVIGLAAGPQVVGILSDLFNPTLGVDALRIALLLINIPTIGAAFLFLAATRPLRSELRLASSPG